MTTTPIEPFLPPLPRSFVAGGDLDLLSPLVLVEPSAPPSLWPVPRGPEMPAVSGGDRSVLAAALTASNRSYGHPAARELGDKLADPRTRVVVTGQQAGFLGGPLYTLTKAVAAARWAEEIERQGVPAVAVFWVATEDHDHAEVRSCCVQGADGPVSLSLAAPSEPSNSSCSDGSPGVGELVPVGDLALGSEARRVLELVGAELNKSQRLDFERLTECCREEVCFGEAFSRLLVALLGRHCPLLLDAQEPALKELQRPWLRRMIECRHAIDEALAARESEIEERGFALQVTAQRQWSPLFLIDEEGRRRRIGWRGDGYVLRGDEDTAHPIDHLLAILEKQPARISPGAVARPAIQDAVLGTSLFVVGPGELSYLTQAAALYPVLELPATRIALRPQILVLDSRRSEQLDDLAQRGVDLGALLGPEELLEQRLAEIAGGEPVSAARHEILERFDQLEPALTAIEPQLKSAFSKTRSQIERALDLLCTKTTEGLARSDGILRGRASALRSLCRPGGGLQERVVTAAPFYCHFGRALIDTLWDDLDLDPRSLQVLTPHAIQSPDQPELAAETAV